ncbi:Sua5/YciO/YrdC/YwlC family protein [Neolewinella lacunae]|uniref:Sua5/YciO/YrdC/YwlC family protein n=1 Tax=Neolewinella lacunae TaxID=1517758 RepID=A0A923PR81_9BACT|nr:Sua5/YciO/YrdC/YwlC family protein [Neolewinella lacunae]MBC6996004.1 Sua5/YciO/YrdC/YwlC family protein [Neolewinella lacunae]MDN3633178.1 Sua5/YciO/YrdC/YwlC family protein [Neolewinella lacunae]
MHPPLPPLGSRALSTLHGGGIVLLPTANLWQVVAHVQQPQAITKLLAACPPSRVNRPELIFSDLETLRQWCPQLHPKLETLLAYHRRPLTLHVPAGRNIPLRLHDQRGEVAVRIAFDSFCYRLCEDLEAPLVACLAIGPDDTELPTRFGRVRSDVLRAADYTVQRRQQEELGTHTTVRVRLGEGEELEFLR